MAGEWGLIQTPEQLTALALPHHVIVPPTPEDLSSRGRQDATRQTPSGNSTDAWVGAGEETASVTTTQDGTDGGTRVHTASEHASPAANKQRTSTSWDMLADNPQQHILPKAEPARRSS